MALDPDLERIGRRLAPEMIRDLADLLEQGVPLSRSVATFYHGLGGKVTSMERIVALPSTSLDSRPPKGVESSQIRSR